MINENKPNEPKKNEPSDQNVAHNVNNANEETSTSEFSHIEPVTPKKSHHDEDSLLEKAKGAFSSLTQKEAKMSEKQIDEKIEEININHGQKTTSHEKPHNLKEKLTHPEKWKLLQILPPRYRRVVIILLLVVLILCLITWLKPEAKPVESFEISEEAVPTQFQPIAIEGLNDISEIEVTQMDESQSTEEDNANLTPTNQNIGELSPQTAETEIITPVEEVEEIVEVPVLVQEQTIKPVVETKKIESTQKNTIKAQPVQKVESVFDAAEKANILNSQPVIKNLRAENRILRFRPGVSLMQLFRENKLNIGDVIAMSKVKGAGNKLSQFKAGDKVHVIPGKDGHVAELILNNGSKFIRQSNGSYRFQN